ncbi:MAG: hypothetical protein PF503_12665 [Desulfobacula sp.]|jgi:hypothetical protein|nr:hypothetical protein [Desulfobacula sp.]
MKLAKKMDIIPFQPIRRILEEANRREKQGKKLSTWKLEDRILIHLFI